MSKNSLSKTSDEQREFVERRQEDDWLVRTVKLIAIIGWTFAFVTFVIIDSAKPEMENLFTRLLGIHVRDYWNITLLRISLGALIVTFFTCVIGFFVNMSRHRRKTDRFNKSIIALGTFTFSIILYLLTRLL